MPQTLAQLLRLHRKRSGLTQQEVAELAGVGKNLVYELERGRDTVRFDNLLKVLEVLNIRVEFRSPLLTALQREEDAAG